MKLILVHYQSSKQCQKFVEEGRQKNKETLNPNTCKLM